MVIVSIVWTDVNARQTKKCEYVQKYEEVSAEDKYKHYPIKHFTIIFYVAIIFLRPKPYISNYYPYCHRGSTECKYKQWPAVLTWNAVIQREYPCHPKCCPTKPYTDKCEYPLSNWNSTWTFSKVNVTQNYYNYWSENN